jgi:hypothetical protein
MSRVEFWEMSNVSTNIAIAIIRMNMFTFILKVLKC